MNTRKFSLACIMLCLVALGTKAQTLSSTYANSVTITVDPSMVSGSTDIPDFPLLVWLEDIDDLRSTGNGGSILASGADIVFAPDAASSIGDEYNHYLEDYDETTGSLIVWVQVDLSATLKTEFEMFYGRGTTTKASTSVVWTDADFQGVWQLSETPGTNTIIDAAGLSANGTANNMDASNIVPSLVGNGYSFDGNNEFITIPDNANIEPAGSFTISCWFQTSGTQNAYAKMFAKGRTTSPYASYTLEMRPLGGNNDDEIGFQTARLNNNHVITESTANGIDDINTGEWNYFVGVVEESGGSYTQTMYLNGEEISSSTDQATSGINYYGTAYDLTIGGLNDGGLNNAFTGIIDELRIAEVARSEDYIKTELRNTACVSSYMTVETLGGLACSASSLPVTFTSIDAKRIGDQVEIIWSTASEENNDYFTIEKSLDNLHFEEIGTRLGAGNSNEILDYQFTDYNSPDGLVYYRIKQTDFDGSFDHSKVVKVTGQFQNGSILSLYPNPSNTGETLNITLSDIQSDVVWLSISNLSGSKVYYEKIEGISEEHFTHNLLTRDILPGTYLLTVVSSKHSFSEKIIIR